MLLRRVCTLAQKFQPYPMAYMFASTATAAKKEKMEMTLRGSGKTFYENFSDFHRIITKSNSGSLVIQNKTPACQHTLPAGELKVKFQEVASGPVAVFNHQGGHLTVHPNNTVDIQLEGCNEEKMTNMPK